MRQTDNFKHKKITIPLPWNKKCKWTITYYIAEIGKGEHLIHCRINNNIKSEGYCGETLKFLLENGDTEEVQGPFYEYPEHHERIFDYLREAQIDNPASH